MHLKQINRKDRTKNRPLRPQPSLSCGEYGPGFAFSTVQPVMEEQQATSVEIGQAKKDQAAA